MREAILIKAKLALATMSRDVPTKMVAPAGEAAFRKMWAV